MSWLKKAGKWLKGAGEKAVDTAEDVVEDIGEVVKDVGEGASKVAKDVGNSSKFVAEGLVNSVIKVSNAAGDLVNAPDIPMVDFTDHEGFLKEKSDWINEFVKSNAKLIEQAAGVAKNLAKHKDEIKAARKSNQPLSAEIMSSTGAAELLSDAEEEGSNSVSFGVEGDGSAIIGASGSVGINNSISGGQYNVKGFASAAGTIGASAGLDGSLEVGFWQDDYDEIGGWAHGGVIGGSYGGGVALSFWWKMDGGEFAGWTISPQGGVSAELEYTIGRTWI